MPCYYVAFFWRENEATEIALYLPDLPSFLRTVSSEYFTPLPCRKAKRTKQPIALVRVPLRGR